jgi:hypothetical protein
MEALGLNSHWKKIIQQGRDESIGAMLVRLAHQATQLHQHEVARAAGIDGRAGGTSPRAESPIIPAAQGGER